MKKVSYYEDWSLTNPNEFSYDSIDERMGLSEEESGRDRKFNLPSNFDCSAFDDKQMEYLSDYLTWYRKDISQQLLSFLVKPAKDLKNSERSRNATNMRMLCRLVLTHKIINDLQTGYRDLPAKFGISNHVFYDERKRIIDDLCEVDKNISFTICNNRHLK